ncbi:MAG: hypothetical protein OXG58_05370 [Gemmatimonadetes bacterium]|nr:hypothetical protein [Gemmatimonadota bacterium]MCY3942900.1 hypothetical protein [Gemmatimonadota bacterium]
MRPSARLTIAVLTGIACADSGDPPPVPPEASVPAFEILDTAGVPVVENARPPADSRLGWRIGEKPVLSIGEVAGPDPYLLDLSDVLRMPDGRIIVADRASGELRAFDTLGVHLATWGGSGEGPGEFVNLVHVDPWPGDSLVARWSQGNRLTVFDSQGNYGRVFGMQDRVRISVETVLPGGLVIGSRQDPTESPQAGLSRSRSIYEIRGPEGEPGPTIGSFPGSEWYSPPVEDRIMVIGIPFSRGDVVVPWGDDVIVGSDDTYEIRVYSTDGTLKRIVRREHNLIPTTPAHLDAHIERRVAGLPEPERAARRREEQEWYRDVRLPETHPAFRRVLADELNHLWIQEYTLPGQGRGNPVWTVFDPEGHVLGLMETPAGLRVYQIGEDYILGYTTDELGVEYVQVWSLSRSGR